jgi:uncharacterized protein
MRCLCAILLLAASGAAAETWSGPPVLVTSGDATLRVAPNRAFVHVGTEGRAPGARDAQRGEAEAMTAVRKQLRDAGLPDDAIRTLAYDLQQEFDYAGGKQTPRGFVARHTIEVRVDDVERLGDLLAKAVGSGAGQISGVRFDVKERDQLERQALKQAVEDARARADAAAAGAGATVAGIVRLEEQRVPEGPRPMIAARGVAAEAMATPTPIAPGEIEIRATVTLTSSLK